MVLVVINHKTTKFESNSVVINHKTTKFKSVAHTCPCGSHITKLQNLKVQLTPARAARFVF